MRPYDSIVLEGSSILVADDTPTNLAILRTILTNEGYVITTAKSGEELLDIINDVTPVLILLDVVMPGIDGYETCRILKENKKTQEIPIIFVTGRTDIKDIVEGFKAGAVDYITKPIQREEVCARVRTHLQSRAYLLNLIAKTRELQESNESLQKEIAHRKKIEGELRFAKEIATSTVHNIGNVITSINISTQAMIHLLNNSKLEAFAKANKLMDEHRSDMHNFINNDPLGQKIVDLYIKFGDMLEKQNGMLLEETQTIIKQVGFIREVTTAQQSFAKNKAGDVDATIEEIIDESIKMLLSFGQGKWIQIRKNINFENDYYVPKLEVTHVIMNLIKNAKEAVAENSKSNRIINIDVSLDSTHQVVISVSDNGVGISENILEKIFHHGFTTKDKGHGFGLDYCEKVLKEIGGSISAHSDGPGKGATFIVRMPEKFQKTGSDKKS